MLGMRWGVSRLGGGGRTWEICLLSSCAILSLLYSILLCTVDGVGGFDLLFFLLRDLFRVDASPSISRLIFTATRLQLHFRATVSRRQAYASKRVQGTEFTYRITFIFVLNICAKQYAAVILRLHPPVPSYTRSTASTRRIRSTLPPPCSYDRRADLRSGHS